MSEEKKSVLQRVKDGILAGVLFLYVCGSVLVMNHLVNENNSFCAQRSVARTAIRTLFEDRQGWTVENQVYLDKNLPEFVQC